jgi:hypothetical protein
MIVIYAVHHLTLDSFLICMSFASFEPNHNKLYFGIKHLQFMKYISPLIVLLFNLPKYIRA